MIITIIRSILSSLGVALNTAKTYGYKTFFGTGRADEHITGKMYQHYGFSSMPPTNACELITLQYGNNNISIAENDGGQVANISMAQNDVMLYGKNQDDDYNSIYLNMKSGGVKIEIESTGGISMQADQDIDMAAPDGNIGLSATRGTVALLGKVTAGQDGPGGYYPLLTINFYNQEFSTHTHNVTAVGSPTGPAIIVAGPLPKATSNTEAN
jgi:hypothetical protein